MATTPTGLGGTALKGSHAPYTRLEPRTESKHFYVKLKGLLSCINHPRKCLSWTSGLAAFRPRGYPSPWCFLPHRLKRLLQKLSPAAHPALGQVLPPSSSTENEQIQGFINSLSPQLLCLAAPIDQTQTWHPTLFPALLLIHFCTSCPTHLPGDIILIPLWVEPGLVSVRLLSAVNLTSSHRVSHYYSLLPRASCKPCLGLQALDGIQKPFPLFPVSQRDEFCRSVTQKDTTQYLVYGVSVPR